MFSIIYNNVLFSTTYPDSGKVEVEVTCIRGIKGLINNDCWDNWEKGRQKSVGSFSRDVDIEISASHQTRRM